MFHLDLEQMLAFIKNIRDKVRAYQQIGQMPEKLCELFQFVQQTIGKNISLSVQSLLDQYTENNGLSYHAMVYGINAVRRVMRAVRAVTAQYNPRPLHQLAFADIALLGFNDIKSISIDEVRRLDHTQSMAFSLVLKELARTLARNKDFLPAQIKEQRLRHFEALLFHTRERVNAELSYVPSPEIQHYVMHARSFLARADRHYFGRALAVAYPPIDTSRIVQTMPAMYFLDGVNFAGCTAADIRGLRLDEILSFSDIDQLRWFLSHDVNTIISCSEPQKMRYWLEALKYLHHFSSSARLQIAIEEQMVLLQRVWLNNSKALPLAFSKQLPTLLAIIDGIRAVGFARQQVGAFSGAKGLRSPIAMTDLQLGNLKPEQILRCDLADFGKLYVQKAKSLALAIWANLQNNAKALAKVDSIEFMLFKRLNWLYQQQVANFKLPSDEFDLDALEDIEDIVYRATKLLPKIVPFVLPPAAGSLVSLAVNTAAAVKLPTAKEKKLAFKREEAKASKPIHSGVAYSITEPISSRAKRVLQDQFGRGKINRYEHYSLPEITELASAKIKAWEQVKSNTQKYPGFDLTTPDAIAKTTDFLQKIQKEIWFFTYDQKSTLCSYLERMKKVSKKTPWDQLGYTERWIDSFNHLIDKTHHMAQEGSNVVKAARAQGSFKYLFAKDEYNGKILIPFRLYSDLTRQDYSFLLNGEEQLKPFFVLIHRLIQDDLSQLRFDYQEHLSQIPGLLLSFREFAPQFYPKEKQLLTTFLDKLASKAQASNLKDHAEYQLWFANLELAIARTRIVLSHK